MATEMSDAKIEPSGPLRVSTSLRLGRNHVSPILARRLEYGLTHAALVALASRIDGLGGRCVLPPIAPAVPWGDGEVAKMVG